MGTISLQIPQSGQPNATEDPKIASDLGTIQTAINGNLDGTNLTTTTAQSAGVNGVSTVKGSSVIAASENITSTSYATAPTADQVSGINVPANAVVLVSFRALITKTAGSTSQGLWAALYFGVTPAANMFDATSGVPGVQNPGYQSPFFEQQLMATYGPTVVGVVTTDQQLGFALAGADGAGHTPQDNALIGQQVGVFVPVALAAGSYNVVVKWKVDSGASCSVANRRLYVKAEVFT